MSIPSNGGNQNMKIIPERDLYRLILKSKKPEAERFEEWVVSEVLPSIRKTGGYIVEKENDTPEEIMARALIVAQETLKRRDERIRALEIVVTEQTPKVEFADKLLKSKDCILIRDYAKILFDENINIGEKRLYKWLRDNKYLMSDNLPYQSFMKYFSVKENSFDTAFGVKITKTTLINPEGQLYFYHKLKNKE
jgi:anti-repressor protein